MAEQHRWWSPGLKQDAVNLVRASPRPMDEIAQDRRPNSEALSDLSMNGRTGEGLSRSLT
jgi:hypothetical protein